MRPRGAVALAVGTAVARTEATAGYERYLSRKTDVTDAAWLAQLGAHGLVRASRS